jgi:MFS family permease
MSPQAAAGVSAIMTLGFVTGNLFLPVLSDRIGLRKPFVFTGAIIGAALLYISWLLAPGAGVWVLAYLGGTIVGGAPPVLFSVPAELPEIGEAYVGGASGLIVSSMNAGGFLLSVLITSPIMAAGTIAAYTTGFLISMIFLGSIAVPALFLTETGKRKKRQKS